MGYFDDEYFIEFDDSPSAPRKTGAQQRRPAGQRGNTYHSDNRRMPTRGSNRDPRGRGASDRPMRGRGYDDFLDGVSYRERVDDRSKRSMRPAQRRPVQQRKKRKKFRLTRTSFLAICIIVVLALLIGIIAIAVSSSGVGKVSELKPAQIAADQVSLTWQKANHADGYRILAAQGGSEDFKEYLTVDDPEAVSATVTNLDPATFYSFSVVALRDKKEGDPVKIANVFTLPQAPEITNSYSAQKGTIHLDWTTSDKVNGYVVEYKKDGTEYSADMTQTISDPATGRADIADLEVNATYQVRVYSFIEGDKPLQSAPSEEESIKVVEKDTEIIPKAQPMKPAPGLDPDKPMIALTFDDGPAPNGNSGDRILDTLEQYNAKATFFMVGYNASQNPDNVKRKADLMMELGNHTWDHTHYGTQVVPDDIRRASNQIYDLTGRYPTAFRSPGGMSTEGILTECAAENMSAYYWSIDTQDWNSRDADSIYHAVVDNAKDGDIVLMHEIYDSTADAIERMVPDLIDKGFQLVTCHDLIALKGGADPVPGTQYVDAFRTMTP